MQYVMELITSAWMVLGQMAPYLLFGFLMAGVLSVLMSPEWVERHLGGRGVAPIVKAAVLGVPLPLCSCGVIPVAASIRNHGASRGATTAFLLSTPQTGVDSMLATYALLGPVYAVFRPVVALLTGIAGGLAVSVADRNAANAISEAETGSPGCSDACCSGASDTGPIMRALRYGFVTLPADLAKPLLLGILVAGVIAAFVSKDVLAPYLGGGMSAMLAMIAIGIPIYVCSTASIPIAVGFMHMGASPGAALAFLIAGPATNAAAISVIWKLLGRRTAVVYLITVAVGALLAGWSLDLVYAYLSESGHPLAQHVHEGGGGWFGHVSATVLLAVLFGSLMNGTLRRRIARSPEPKAANEESVTLGISGMHCSHCANTIERALSGIPGVEHATVDLAQGLAIVTGKRLDVKVLAKRVDALGYEASVPLR